MSAFQLRGLPWYAGLCTFKWSRRLNGPFVESLHEVTRLDKRLNFYREFFETGDDARRFVSHCEAQSAPDNAAKIIMHQAQRLISISDDIPKIRPSREGLQLLFLIMCAENVSKLQDNFKGEGKSRKYVRRFFKEFLLDKDKDQLGNGFTDNRNRLEPSLGLDRAIDLLYDLRCDVVHEGNYWGLAFHDGKMPMLNVDPDVTAYIRIGDLRAVVARGCIQAAKSRL